MKSPARSYNRTFISFSFCCFMKQILRIIILSNFFINIMKSDFITKIYWKGAFRCIFTRVSSLKSSVILMPYEDDILPITVLFSLHSLFLIMLYVLYIEPYFGTRMYVNICAHILVDRFPGNLIIIEKWPGNRMKLFIIRANSGIFIQLFVNSSL